MELTQLGSRSITLSNDDEPTIATNTRSTLPPQPYAHEPEEPSPMGELLPAPELAAAPLTEFVVYMPPDGSEASAACVAA